MTEHDEKMFTAVLSPRSGTRPPDDGREQWARWIVFLRCYRCLIVNSTECRVRWSFVHAPRRGGKTFKYLIIRISFEL
jgi:hypothetical protein